MRPSAADSGGKVGRWGKGFKEKTEGFSWILGRVRKETGQRKPWKNSLAD